MYRLLPVRPDGCDERCDERPGTFGDSHDCVHGGSLRPSSGLDIHRICSIPEAGRAVHFLSDDLDGNISGPCGVFPGGAKEAA